MTCRLPFQQDVDFGNATSHLGDCDGKLQENEMEASGCVQEESKLPLLALFSITSTVDNVSLFCFVGTYFCNMTCYNHIVLTEASLSELNQAGVLDFGFRSSECSQCEAV